MSKILQFCPDSFRLKSCHLQENGCLQVVPGSHTRDFDHVPGSGVHAQGEWAAPGDGGGDGG